MDLERGDRSDDLDALSDELAAISERLGDLAMSAIRAALEDPDFDGRRPELDKRLAKARRSVDKAVSLLRDQPHAGLS